MNKKIMCLVKTLVYFLPFITFNYSIAQIPTPYLWLRADSVNHQQNYWIDLSGQNHHVYFNHQIDTGTINYQLSLKVETTTPYVLPYRPKEKDVISMFVVYKMDTTQQNYSIWSVRLDSSKYIEMNVHFVRTLYKIHTYEESGSSPVINFLCHDWVNQRIDTTYAHLNICGGDSIKSFRGLIAEILFYNKTLTSDDLIKISTYLAIKYGITLQELNYKDSKDTILWDVAKNKIFSHEIAGIGRDTLLQINQKQSAGNGGKSILKIAAGNRLYKLNKENLYEINDGDFLIWGENGGSLLDFSNDTSEISLIKNLSQKRWLMERRGSTAHTIPTTVMIFAPEIARDTAVTLNLVINPSAKSEFQSDSCLIIPADSVDSLGNFYFHNIYWDTDFSGSDVFTFQLDTIQRATSQSDITWKNDRATDENVNEITIHVYPNPSRGLFNVQIGLPKNEDVTLFVQDETGKTFYQKNLYKSNYYFESFRLNSKGVYVLNIETKKKRKSVKLEVL